MHFPNRAAAGRALADELRGDRAGPHPIVLGLPRGGIPVAAEVAGALDAPLDLVLVRKVGAPDRPELAVGAVGEDGVTVRNDAVLVELGLTWDDLSTQVEHERSEIERRAAALRPARTRPSLRGRQVVLVDDGIATGATVVAAVRVLRRLGAGRVVLAVPVAPADTLARLREIADDVVCVLAPRRFVAVGQWYDDFTQVTDDEVRALLAQFPTPLADEDVVLDGLGGFLFVPARAVGLVVFAHGSGSGRASPRNRAVSSALHAAGIGTVLVDLVAPGEEFDVDLLAGRLRLVVDRLRGDHRLAGLPVGLFGASTGAAAALRAAAEPALKVSAIVSRGGRPDLAGEAIAVVDAPTLLVVGGRDEQVLALNAAARERMRCHSELVVVPGAGHLFEELGTLEAVARLAADWFTRHFAQPGGPGRDGVRARRPR
ncbi:phosphoribosyltransferase family protein [Actinophytocola xanthii]|uniref:Phosphoribosyltransferase domain-containing protein n=1 Tax=Actinophytocola xanthii TaxID=1912961 RepID=A0A1Q8CYK5_9PSEU|nr:phosphoribosyltransferase family protein [Actinophytocola xanthii]OLF19441.1 hypothetical protein BU204_00500 [Actinophytocola xanthii]